MANYGMIVDNSMVNGSGEETCFRFIVCEVDS